jgi:hypothetical protein
MIEKNTELDEAFKAFDGNGFKIAFSVKTEVKKNKLRFEIDMSFDPLPKAKYRDTTEITLAQHMPLFGDIRLEAVPTEGKEEGCDSQDVEDAREGNPVDAEWEPDIEGEAGGGPQDKED